MFTSNSGGAHYAFQRRHRRFYIAVTVAGLLLLTVSLVLLLIGALFLSPGGGAFGPLYTLSLHGDLQSKLNDDASPEFPKRYNLYYSVLEIETLSVTLNMAAHPHHPNTIIAQSEVRSTSAALSCSANNDNNNNTKPVTSSGFAPCGFTSAHVVLFCVLLIADMLPKVWCLVVQRWHPVRVLIVTPFKLVVGTLWLVSLFSTTLEILNRCTEALLLETSSAQDGSSASSSASATWAPNTAPPQWHTETKAATAILLVVLLAAVAVPILDIALISRYPLCASQEAQKQAEADAASFILLPQQGAVDVDITDMEDDENNTEEIRTVRGHRRGEDTDGDGTATRDNTTNNSLARLVLNDE